MTQPIKTKQQFHIRFTDNKQQKLGVIIFCKKPSLAHALSQGFDIDFYGKLEGNRNIRRITELSFAGPAGSDVKLRKALEALKADIGDQIYLNKERIKTIVDEINLTGSVSRTGFNAVAAANQNHQGAQRGRTGAYVFVPKTEGQAQLSEMIDNNDLTFGVGPAGTGKTHVAIAKACKALQNKQIEKIMLARPAVEAGGKGLGALPGGLEDKLAPYMRPLYDELEQVLGRDAAKRMLMNGDVEIVPVEMMRGRTLRKAFIILDEGQNCTKEQMKMALTRIGEGSKMVVTGDPMQTDLAHKADSGLKWAYDRLEGKANIGVQFFTAEDIVRHEVVRVIVNALEENNEASPGLKKSAPAAKPSR